MAKELLWKRAVRRGIESARRNPRNCNFEQACELSAFVIGNLRRRLANGADLSEEEINRRVSLYLIESDQVERRIAATWKQVMVTVRE